MAASDLVVSVGANIAALEREMKAAARVSEKAAEDIESRFKKVNPSISTSALTGALKGLAAAFTVDRLIRGLADANAELIRIGDTAKRVGLDLQRFQELQFAGRQSGVSGKDFGTGLEGLAEKLNEARQKENDLSQLFSDNNIKLKDRKGEVIGINDALGQVANLVRNAATEFDKIKIAEAVGLTRDWIPLLEQGAEAINKQAARAREAGAVIDSDVIDKARAFERDWTAAVDRWANLFKANLGGIIGLIDAVIGKASELLGYLGRYAEKTSALADIEQNGFAGASRDTTKFAANEYRKKGVQLDKDLAAREEYFQDLDRERPRTGAFQRTRTRKEFEAEQPRPAGGSKTDTSSLFNKGGGGSGGGKSDEEQAQARLDRYIESLVRQRAVMEAEIATVGKSNAERKAAVEIAKAQVDLEKLSTTEKANYIAKLTQEVTANEAVRASKERLEQKQKDLNEAQKFFGNAAVDALEDMIVNGAKAEDVMKRLAASLVKAALQAALLGDGPLAGFFGAKGVGGSMGGLFGMLFGGGVKAATGGYVSGPGSGRSDSIPARLSNGEYVINAHATKQNRALLDAINSGKLPAFADGGMVGRIPSIPAARASGGMTMIVQNTVSDRVQATPQRQSNGDMRLVISAIQGAIADDLVRGQGPIATAQRAISTGHHRRG
ncbi:hypothetical protein LJR090_002558 [Bosea sp. LjRoot90]|uniref:hypothetical protein n=1 Tax=Bosea sp. LjRoot90 TaxID=3342342 RepID=UPI003ED08161